MIADPTYGIEKSLRKSQLVHSKSSVSYELGTEFRENILVILSIHVHSFCLKTMDRCLTLMFPICSSKTVVCLIAANVALLLLAVLTARTISDRGSVWGLVMTNTIAYRFLCYRFRMLPCSPKSESGDRVTQAAEESPNA
jgi:hypothetical protein